MRLSSTMIVLLVLIALATTALAAPPTTVSYQGRLTTSAGTPVPNGTYSVRFSLWSDATLGTESWSETQMVSVIDGLFSTELGSISGGFFDISVCPPYCDAYLQIEVTIGGGVVTISPRSHLSASPWSLVSRSHYSESSSGLQKAKGTIKNGTGGGLPNGIIVLEGDVDGDGHADYSLNDSVTTSSASRKIGRDLTGDGVPDLVVASTVDANSAHFEVGDKPTQPQFGTMIDSYVNYVDDRAVLGLRSLNGLPPGTPALDNIAIETNGDSASVTLRSLNGLPPGTPWIDNVKLTTNGTSSRHVIRGGMSGSTTGTIRLAATPDSTESVLEHDSDGDGIPETSDRRTVSSNDFHHNVISRSGSTTGTIRMAVKPDSAELVFEGDSDGDGHAEARGIITAKPGTISSKGTVAMMCDSDDDGIPDNTTEMTVTPTKSSLAIKTKGTSAQRQSIALESESDSAFSVLESDADGDGIAGAKVHTRVRDNHLQGGVDVMTALRVDSDDDGIPDNTAEMTVTPTKSSLAIKTKGTSAQRLSVGGDCDDVDASLHTGYDTDGDGVADGSIVMKSSAGGSGSIIRGGMSGSTTATIRMQATPDSTVFDLGYSGSTTGTIRMKAGSAGTANPIEHSSGAVLTVGGVWTNASDKRLKENFEQVDGAEILEKIEDLPISEWNYKAEGDDTRHIGPTAQDFSDAFGLGSSDKTISTIDPSGVALVAIKQLTKQNKELKKKNTELENKLNDLQKQIEKLAISMKK